MEIGVAFFYLLDFVGLVGYLLILLLSCIIIGMHEDYIEIDGSLHEGGGQMIRSSLALATILHKGFNMHSIRKNRPKPGINNQLRSVFSAFAEKSPKVGDQEIYIFPNFTFPKHIRSESAASCTLMLQCFVPVFAALGYNSDVKIEGGTDVSKSPCQESIQLGLIPLMQRMGVQLNIIDLKKGYYPKGHGYMIFNVKCKQQIQPIDMTKFTGPNKVVVTYYIKTDKLPNQSKDFMKELRNMLKQAFPDRKIDFQIKVHRVSYTKDDYGIGCMVIGDGMVWDVGTVGEKVEEAVILDRLRHYIQTKPCLDEHHQDQLLLLAALAAGKSRFLVGEQLSLHTESLMYVIQKFIPQFKYSLTEGGILEVQGIGYKCKVKQENEDQENQ